MDIRKEYRDSKHRSFDRLIDCQSFHFHCSIHLCSCPRLTNSLHTIAHKRQMHQNMIVPTEDPKQPPRNSHLSGTRSMATPIVTFTPFITRTGLHLSPHSLACNQSFSASPNYCLLLYRSRSFARPNQDFCSYSFICLTCIIQQLLLTSFYEYIGYFSSNFI